MDFVSFLNIFNHFFLIFWVICGVGLILAIEVFKILESEAPQSTTWCSPKFLNFCNVGKIPRFRSTDRTNINLIEKMR